LSRDEHITELSEAARRAGYIVTEQIDSIVERAEQQAEMILRQAERDAEDTRREAVAAAKRLLDRIHALEFPLGELVVSLRDEMEGVSRELEAGQHVDSHATSLPPAPEGASTPQQHEAVAEPDLSEAAFEPPEPAEPVERGEPAERDEPEFSSAPAGREASRRPAASELTDDESGKGSLLTRRRAKPKTKGMFITIEGHCAVCHRSFQAGSAEALASSGWRVSGDVGLCPDCQADRWELPDGARLPVRPGGA
jgi:hypothetical protein